MYAFFCKADQYAGLIELAVIGIYTGSIPKFVHVLEIILSSVFPKKAFVSTSESNL